MTTMNRHNPRGRWIPRAESRIGGLIANRGGEPTIKTVRQGTYARHKREDQVCVPDEKARVTWFAIVSAATNDVGITVVRMYGVTETRACRPEQLFVPPHGLPVPSS